MNLGASARRTIFQALAVCMLAYTWDKVNANAPSKRDTQYFEMLGNRAIYHTIQFEGPIQRSRPGSHLFF